MHAVVIWRPKTIRSICQMSNWGQTSRYLGQSLRRPHDPERRTSADAVDADDDADDDSACLAGWQAVKPAVLIAAVVADSLCFVC